MTDWIWSWFNGNCNVNTNTGSQMTGTLDASRRQGENWNGSGNIEIFNVGIEGNIHVVKAETTYANDLGAIILQGPSAGADFGLKNSNENIGVSAMVELSAAKAEIALGPLYASGNWNANTGFKLGTGGVQASYFGFGMTLGVGGRWTIDTPFGSLGAATATLREKVKEKQSVHRRVLLVNN